MVDSDCESIWLIPVLRGEVEFKVERTRCFSSHSNLCATIDFPARFAEQMFEIRGLTGSYYLARYILQAEWPPIFQRSMRFKRG